MSHCKFVCYVFECYRLLAVLTRWCCVYLFEKVSKVAVRFKIGIHILCSSVVVAPRLYFLGFEVCQFFTGEMVVSKPRSELSKVSKQYNIFCFRFTIFFNVDGTDDVIDLYGVLRFYTEIVTVQSTVFQSICVNAYLALYWNFRIVDDLFETIYVFVCNGLS